MATEKQIRGFTLSPPEDTDVLHTNKITGEDRSCTIGTLKANFLAAIPQDPTIGSLPTKAIVPGDKFIIEGSGGSAEYQVTLATLRVYFGNLFYPVGSIYENRTNSTNPSTLLGFGTWVRLRGRVRVGEGSSTDINGVEQNFPIGTTGGEYSHSLTEDEMPYHSHALFSREVIAPARKFSLGDRDAAVALNPSGTDGWNPWEGVSGPNHLNTGTTGKTGGYEGVPGGGSLHTPRHNNVQPYLVTYQWERVA